MVRKYYDLGDFDNNLIRMSDKSLSKILRAVVRCNASITSSYEFNGHYKNPNTNTVVFRLNMPENDKEKFEQMTGFKLSIPERVTGTEIES